MPPSLHGPDIPDKLHYRISEVCELTDTQPYVLKFWEQEFPQLAPEKNRIGQRLYGKRDIELVRRIKYLLQEKEYTIAAVRQALERGGAAPAAGSERVTESPAVRGGGAAARERETARGDMREDLSGLLFDQTSKAGGPTGAGRAPAAQARRDGEENLAATAGAADLALIETLRAERDRAVLEAERLRERLARAGGRIRDVISSLDTLPDPSDTADS